MVKGFKLAAKNFFLTYPKCTMSREDALACLHKRVDIEYACIARELHEDGTPHLHVLLCCKKKVSSRSAKYFDLAEFHGNYQAARKTDDVLEYINKSDTTPLAFGTYTGNDPSRVQKRALENKMLLTTPLPELVNDGTISIYSYQVLKQAKQAYIMDSISLPNIIDRECIWIYGEPRIGKTYWVRSRFENIFVKAQNKWWDGYCGEDIVILDDFDSSQLGHMLKIWADNYSFNAEVKGGNVKPVYTKLYVTSNYLPYQIFKEDSILADAIAKRFKIMTIDSDRNLSPWSHS